MMEIVTDDPKPEMSMEGDPPLATRGISSTTDMEGDAEIAIIVMIVEGMIKSLVTTRDSNSATESLYRWDAEKLIADDEKAFACTVRNQDMDGAIAP